MAQSQLNPVKEQDILSLYRDRKFQALDIYKWFFQRTQRRYGMFRGLYVGNPSAYRNTIYVPTVFKIIMLDVARKITALLSNFPYIDYIPVSPDDGPRARKLSKLISLQLDEAEILRRLTDELIRADLYGTAIIRDGWVETIRRQRIRVTEPLQDGRILEGFVDRDMTLFDGPKLGGVDLTRFIPEPGKKYLSDMKWTDEMYNGDYEDLVAKSKGDNAIYDADAVKRIETAGGEGSLWQVPPTALLYRYGDEYNERVMTRSDKNVDLDDMIGWFPDELCPDGVNWRLLTVANDRTILRFIPLPWLHGELPYYEITPMSDPHYFHGVGKAEIIEKLHYLACKYASQKADALDQSIAPHWLVNTLVGIDTEKLFIRAGGVTGIPAPVTDDNIKPMSADFRGLQMVYPEMQQISQWEQEATGLIDDVSAGLPGPARETARGFVGRQEAAQARPLLEALIIEDSLFMKLGKRWPKLNQQFLKVPKEIALLGKSAFQDPITGMQMKAERIQIGMEDISSQYSCRATGAVRALGRLGRQESMMRLLPMVAQIPPLAQAMAWVNFGKFAFELFDFPNLDDFFVEKMPMVNQLAGQTGQSPEQTVNSLDSMLTGQASQPNIEAILAAAQGGQGGY